MHDEPQRATLRSIFVVTAVYTMGAYTAYSYIEPFLLQAAGADEGLVAAALAFFGIAWPPASPPSRWSMPPRSLRPACALAARGKARLVRAVLGGIARVVPQPVPFGGFYELPGRRRRTCGREDGRMRVQGASLYPKQPFEQYYIV